MSVKTYTDSTTRIITKTIEEHVWEIRCDAVGCNNSLEFRENQDTGDITADGDYTGDMDNEWLNIHDTNTAIQTALQHGWQEGNKGIQFGLHILWKQFVIQPPLFRHFLLQREQA